MTVYTDINEIPLFKYNVIYADPAWLYENYSKSGEKRNANQHYKCIPTDEICSLPVGPLASPDSVLFIWGTSPMLPDCLDVIKAFGFKYKGKAFCWAKANPIPFENAQGILRKLNDVANWFMGLGYGTRSNTEDCWIATTGKPQRKSKGVRELIIAPRRQHSRKPDEVYERIEALFDGPYLELFGRTERAGWDVWGNEVGKFQEVPA